MCHFFSYQLEGAPVIQDIIICVFLRHESEAQSLSAPLSSPGWWVCPQLCWDKFSWASGFSYYYMLKWNKRPLLRPKSSQTGIVLIWYPSKQSSAKARTRTIKLLRLLEVHVLPQLLLEVQHHTGEVARIPLSFEDSGTYLYPFDAVYIQMGYNCLVGKAVEVETVGYPVHTRLLHL